MRVIGWFFSGLLLSLVPLIIVAVSELHPGQSFIAVLTNEELLAVAFTLAGASGIDALISNSMPALRKLQVAVGGLTMVTAFLASGLYVVFKKHVDHLDPATTATMEGWIYIGAAALSLFSEAVA